MGTQPKWVQTPAEWLGSWELEGGLRGRGCRTKHDEPLGVLNTLLVGLRITQRGVVDLVGLVDLALGAVADEDGLTTPLDDDLEGSAVSGTSLQTDCRPLGRGERTFLPSGMAPRPISTLAWARTSAEADMLTRKSVDKKIEDQPLGSPTGCCHPSRLLISVINPS